jgi:hypothetical protein
MAITAKMMATLVANSIAVISLPDAFASPTAGGSDAACAFESFAARLANPVAGWSDDCVCAAERADGFYELWMHDLRQGGERKLTSIANSNASWPVWISDGSALA